MKQFANNLFKVMLFGLEMGSLRVVFGLLGNDSEIVCGE